VNDAGGVLIEGSKLHTLRGVLTMSGASITQGEALGALALDAGGFRGTLTISSTSPSPTGGTTTCITTQFVEGAR
jgi:hypothetical protein